MPNPIHLPRSIHLLLLLLPLVTRALTKPTVVICPGFGNDSIDYLSPLSLPPSSGLVAALSRRGLSSRTVPVKRADWLRVAGGLLDRDFYSNAAKPTGLGYGWYLDRLKTCVDEAFEESGERVILVGHSAGGWLARAALGDGTWGEGVEVRERVSCLVTLGAIHRPPPAAGSCVTRGALAFTDEMYPGAFLAGLGYVSVGGDAISGDDRKEVPKTEADRVYAVRGEGSSSRVAFTSYKSICGDGTVSGDGVVPLEWAHLHGAKQITLEGVIHSINEAGTTIPTDRWYGSDGVIDRWLPQVLQEAQGEEKQGMSINFDALQQFISNILK